MSSIAVAVQVGANPSLPHIICCIPSKNSFSHLDTEKREWFGQSLEFGSNKKQQHVLISRDLAYRLLQGSIEKGDINLVRHVQTLIIHNGLETVGVLADHLIRFFASHGSLVQANHTFAKVFEPSQYTWNAIINAHAKLGEDGIAIHIYDRMHDFIKPGKFTFPNILKACGIADALEQGRQIHEEIRQNGVEIDNMVGNSLIDMYAKCGSLEEACNVFNSLSDKSAASWNAVIAGFVQDGKAMVALELYQSMELEGIKPSKVTFLSILKACARTGTIEKGRQICEQIIGSSFCGDIMVKCALVDMYAKCGNMEEARKMFDETLNRNLVTWNAMLAGYAQHGEGALALECFGTMQSKGIRPDEFTMSSMLKACGCAGAIQQGRSIHKLLVSNGYQYHVIVTNSLVDMYAKCGSLDEAQRVFNGCPNRNVVTWGAIIGGYAQLGEARLALHCFEQMKYNYIKQDDIAFSGILTAFGRAGLVDEGFYYFKTMRAHGIKPNLFHITCAVDLLGRAGCFSEAEDVLGADGVQPDLCLWVTLLDACKVYVNVELGRRCFNEIIHLDPNYTGAYVRMSDIYASTYMADGVCQLTI